MFRCRGRGEFDVVDGGEAGEEELGWEEVHDCVEAGAGHYVDEQSATNQYLDKSLLGECASEDLRSDFVQAMEDETVPPHRYGYRVVAEGEAVGGDEEAFGVREEPDAEDHEQVDEVAEVGEEVVVADFVVVVPAHGHEVSTKSRVSLVERRIQGLLWCEDVRRTLIALCTSNGSIRASLRSGTRK